MRIEYVNGQVYWADLHSGDMMPNGTILTEDDIDETGHLKHESYISNTTNDFRKK